MFSKLTYKVEEEQNFLSLFELGSLEISHAFAENV